MKRGFLSICLLAAELLLAACSTLAPEKPTLCPVHKIPLEEELVLSHPGSPRFEYEKAHDQLFPHSGTRFTGDFQTRNEYSNLLICPECRRQEHALPHGKMTPRVL